MNYTEAIIDLAKESMTPKGFELLMFIEGKMVDIWDRPTSSSGKYHKKEDGSIPSNAHHVFEMLFSASKIIRMFGGELVSTQNDIYFMSVVLHDCMKYGKKGNTPHTYNYHDRGMADLLEKNRNALLKHFSEAEMEMMIIGVRYHSGQWSKSIPKGEIFRFDDYPPIVLFIHTLDMLSTADCLKFPIVDNLPF